MNKRQLEKRLRHWTGRDPLLRLLRSSSLETGVPLWLVGGAVRDAALGKRARDLDLAVGRRADRLIRRLEKTWARRGFRVRKRGVTTWRFELEGRKVDLVDAGHRGIEGDLHRRELTINAVAFDLQRNRILDPLRGLRDLRAGRLRLSRPGVMREDPLRALRGARFLAQFPDFHLDRDAARAAMEAGPLLRRAASERVRDELDKMLESPAPRRGLEALERLDLLRYVLPELLPLRQCVAGQNRADVWRHTLDALEQSTRPGRLPAGKLLADPENRRLVRWSLLLHDISKPETLGRKPDGRPTFHGHEELGARRADRLIRRLGASRAFRRRVHRLIRLHLRPGHLADASAPVRGMRRLVHGAGEDLPLLVIHAACDAKAYGSPHSQRRWKNLRGVLLELLALHRELAARPLPRLVTGRDVMKLLGIPAGPEVGQILKRLREQQEDGSIRDRAEALEYLVTLRGGSDTP